MPAANFRDQQRHRFFSIHECNPSMRRSVCNVDLQQKGLARQRLRQASTGVSKRVMRTRAEVRKSKNSTSNMEQ